MKTIYLGSDHGGVSLKSEIADYLKNVGYKVEDLGCEGSSSCDYPVFGKTVAQKVLADKDSLGVLICGSGVGISIAANRVKGIRCVLANSIEIAELGRQHNGANILAMGERTLFVDQPIEILETFLKTEVDKSDRHEKRRSLLDV